MVEFAKISWRIMKEVVCMINVEPKKIFMVGSIVCTVASMAFTLASNGFDKKVETIKIEEAVKKYMENR